ncbi:hypothetical protein O6H91_Y373200 [Diphasiastrum complanatum]|nr:hypothetical protein O6H91_Y373200 [Diphasiastrum complanatum]
MDLFSTCQNCDLPSLSTMEKSDSWTYCGLPACLRRTCGQLIFCTLRPAAYPVCSQLRGLWPVLPVALPAAYPTCDLLQPALPASCLSAAYCDPFVACHTLSAACCGPAPACL